ncbi:MAG: LCP family protein, partial [Bifidobacteriaceae bacterium]|nr:LCP family protein [Bifidobacteriaceae bacterium]
MSDKPPSFTPTNPENGQFNNPESYAPRKLDKASRTTTPKTQIQRVSGEVDLSELQNKKLNYLKNSKKPKIKFTKNNFLKKRKPRWLKTIICLISIIIIFIISIIIWGNQLLHHEQALSKKADTSPAATYLIAGSDKRDKAVNDETQGGRSDTIMLLTLPQSGTPSLISVPRDTYTDIDGHGPNKLNAAYSFGGMKLMVKTIEDNFSIKIDHFIELGFDSMVDIVQSVGNLHLCLDYDVNDNDSGLKWKAGCHDADGKTALAFSRMRYSDPLSDIGRTL